MSELDSAASSATDLAQRLTAVEDELAIRNLIVRYGLAVDCGNAAVAAALHTENCEYIVADPGTGRSDADAIIPARPLQHTNLFRVAPRVPPLLEHRVRVDEHQPGVDQAV